MSESPVVVYGLYKGMFLPHRIGGLCRGREWWVEGPFLKNKQPLHRSILSAGRFEGNQVHGEASRFGLEFGATSIAELLAHLLSKYEVVAVIEDASIQIDYEMQYGREEYALSRQGMPHNAVFARWEQPCKTAEDFECAVQNGAKVFILNPVERTEEDEWNPSMGMDAEYWSHPPILTEALRRSVHWLIGQSNLLEDTHRYVPQAFWDISEQCAGVLVFHADRNGECFTVYSAEDLSFSGEMSRLPSINGTSVFWIECSVPTMLLRWKRALFEACDNWAGECPENLRALVPVQEREIEDDEGEDFDFDGDDVGDDGDETSQDGDDSDDREDMDVRSEQVSVPESDTVIDGEISAVDDQSSADVDENSESSSDAE